MSTDDTCTKLYNQFGKILFVEFTNIYLSLNVEVKNLFINVFTEKMLERGL